MLRSIATMNCLEHMWRLGTGTSPGGARKGHADQAVTVVTNVAGLLLKVPTCHLMQPVAVHTGPMKLVDRQQLLSPLPRRLCLIFALHEHVYTNCLAVMMCRGGVVDQQRCSARDLSGYSCFSCLNSASMVSRGRSLISSMFSHPITCRVQRWAQANALLQTISQLID